MTMAPLNMSNLSQKQVARTTFSALVTLKTNNERFPVFRAPPKPKERGKLKQFCPIEYRGEIIEIFRRHWHHHSTIPTAKGEHLAMDEIHRCSVLEMYRYCHDNQLSQPWAYLWNCWYQKDQYVLWARSAHTSIPRLKTTMIAESTFKQIKHIDLAHHNQPRLDHVIYIILHSFLPRLLDKMGIWLGTKRIGRPTSLAGWQKDFRRAWIFMSKSDEEQKVRRELAVRKSGLKGKAREERLAQIAEDLERVAGAYYTSLETWTCSCPAYLISRFLTCKHLVRAAELKIGLKTKDLVFFRNLRRNHQVPYYHITSIHFCTALVLYRPPITFIPVAARETVPLVIDGGGGGEGVDMEGVEDVREQTGPERVRVLQVVGRAELTCHIRYIPATPRSGT